MRTVILQEFVSIDGMAAGLDGSVSFIPAATAGDQSFGRRQMAFIDSVDTILLGRVTYEMFAKHWPNVTSGDDKPFAEKLNALPKFVFSSTLERAPWGAFDEATIVRGNAVEEITKLKQKPGKDLVIWGSLSLAQSLMTERLIDEYQLIVCPTLMPSGKPLFHEGAKTLDLRLLVTKSFDHGTVLLSYTPAQPSRKKRGTR
jgi:dihydrofolate reductase